MVAFAEGCVRMVASSVGLAVAEMSVKNVDEAWSSVLRPSLVTGA